jgi:DNA-binding protein HU-beta
MGGFIMNKGDLITQIANDAGLTKAASEKAVNSFLQAIGSALKKGDSVALVGFGSFSVSKRAARKGRNPQTGAEIQIPAKNVIKFKAGKGLSEFV